MVGAADGPAVGEAISRHAKEAKRFEGLGVGDCFEERLGGNTGCGCVLRGVLGGDDMLTASCCNAKQMVRYLLSIMERVE